MGRIIWASGVLAAAALWAAGLFVTPVVAAGAGAGSAAAVAAAASYRLGSVICHQQSARSLRLGNVPLPVCARCAGLYIGGVFGAGLGVVWLIGGRLKRRPSRIPLFVVRLAIVAGALPTLLLWLAEHGLSVQVSNSLRAIGALPLGAAVAWVAGAAAGGAQFTDGSRLPEVH